MFDGEIITIEEECPVPTTPDFTISLKSYTSYDKYAATNGMTKNISQANNCDPSTIYDAGAYWGISTNLMKNENYAKTLVINVDGTDKSVDVTDNKYYENITGLSWQAHTHQVSFTFDGKTVTSPKNTHHITGLPHRASPPTTSKGWSNVAGSITWEGSRVNMYYSAGRFPKIKSPIFNIPSSINVQVLPDIRRNDFNVGNPKLQISLTDTNNSDLYYSVLDSNQTYTSNIDTVMESSGTTLCYFTIEYEYMASGIRTYVYKFDVIYR
jgi:hypothetical protein